MVKVISIFVSVFLQQVVAAPLDCTKRNEKDWQSILLLQLKSESEARRIIDRLESEEVPVVDICDPKFKTLARNWGLKESELQEFEGNIDFLGMFFPAWADRKPFILVDFSQNLSANQLARIIVHEAEHLFIRKELRKGAKGTVLDPKFLGIKLGEKVDIEKVRNRKSAKRSFEDLPEHSAFRLVDEMAAFWAEAQKVKSDKEFGFLEVLRQMSMYYPRLYAHGGIYFWALIYEVSYDLEMPVDQLNVSPIIKKAQTMTVQEIEYLIESGRDFNNFVDHWHLKMIESSQYNP